jgi:hypothetical protein
LSDLEAIFKKMMRFGDRLSVQPQAEQKKKREPYTAGLMGQANLFNKIPLDG